MVIGILIAVQINTWSQDRQRLNLKKVLLTQLKEEMFKIYDDIYTVYNYLKIGNDSHWNFIDYIENDAPYNDTMCFDFEFIKMHEYIYPEQAIYSKIKEEGLDVITNDSIRSGVQELYESIFPRISRNTNFNPDISEVLNEFYLENFKINTDSSLSFYRVFENDTLGGRIYSDNIRIPIVFERKGKTRFQTIGYLPIDFENLKKKS